MAITPVGRRGKVRAFRVGLFLCLVLIVASMLSGQVSTQVFKAVDSDDYLNRQFCRQIFEPDWDPITLLILIRSIQLPQLLMIYLMRAMYDWLFMIF